LKNIETIFNVENADPVDVMELFLQNVEKIEDLQHYALYGFWLGTFNFFNVYGFICQMHDLQRLSSIERFFNVFQRGEKDELSHSNTNSNPTYSDSSSAVPQTFV